MRPLQHYLALTVTDIAEILSYHNIDSRKHSILAVNSTSFSWVWTSHLTTWLSSQERLFWVTGKPGSGKSTLMKHLVENQRTKTHLPINASYTWEILHFFFDFSSGAELANSPEGLLRSWIIQLSRHKPKSVTDVPQSLTREIMLDVIVAALHSDSTRFCVFVDGLDEYEGEIQDLLSLLLNVQQRSNIKMCLASREITAIQLTLRDRVAGTLYMQHWNLQSIEKYLKLVNDGAASQLRAPCPPQILSEILRRSDGVMLWARLALENILQGCSEGQDLQSLRVRLEELPREIEGLYERVMSKIPPQAVYEAVIYMRAIEAEGALSLGELRAVLHHARTWSGRQEGVLAVHTIANSPPPWDHDFEKALALSNEQFEYRLRGAAGGLLITDEGNDLTVAEILFAYPTRAVERILNWLMPSEGLESSTWHSNTRFRLVHETFRAYLRRAPLPVIRVRSQTPRPQATQVPTTSSPSISNMRTSPTSLPENPGNFRARIRQAFKGTYTISNLASAILGVVQSTSSTTLSSVRNPSAVSLSVPETMFEVYHIDGKVIELILKDFKESRQLKARWNRHAATLLRIPVLSFYVSCFVGAVLLFMTMSRLEALVLMAFFPVCLIVLFICFCLA